MVNRVALSETEDRDTIRDMSDQTGRGRTAPAAPWWHQAVMQKLERLDITMDDLAAELAVSKASISRSCGHNVNIEVAARIARRLGLPPPVFIAETLAEAREVDDLIKDMRSTRDALLREADAAAATVNSSLDGGTVRRNGSEPSKKRSRVRRSTHE